MKNDKELIKKEAAALIDGSSGKIAMKRVEVKQAFACGEEMLQELEKIEKQAATEVEIATDALKGFIADEMAAGRSEMKKQRDAVMAERGRQIGNLHAGENIKSTRPAHNLKSRIAVCEICQQEIAIINKDIRQPVTDANFEKLPSFDHLPFMPGQQLQYFKCPSCNQTPWSEEDKILTNTGYKIIPKKKEKTKNVR